MIERLAPAKDYIIPLALDGGRRIVTAQSEPVPGWLMGKTEGEPSALIFPESLVAPCRTSGIIYACNLPAAHRTGLAAPLDPSGQIPSQIEREHEDGFLAASLPGGQTGIINAEGKQATLRLRWICLSSNLSIGAVWRCFAAITAARIISPWRAIEHDYIFDAGSGAILNPPGEVIVPAAIGSPEIKLSHPPGWITCFPCEPGRVKVTGLSANGWPRRQLISLALWPDNRIVALFSDGANEPIATAAPLYRRLGRRT